MAKNHRTLTEPEQRKLIETAEADNYEHAPMLIKTCLYHGLRNEETVTLQRRHVSIPKAHVSIERQNTKSDHGVRNVPTPKKYRAEFHDYVRQYDDHEAHIFPSNRGGHITKRTFRNIMTRCALAANLYPDGYTKEDVSTLPEEQRIRPHALRHTYGTQMRNKGVELDSLRDLMGHKSIDITADLYAHIATGHLQDEVDRVW